MEKKMFSTLEKKIIILNNSCPDPIPMNISTNIDINRAAMLRECIFYRIKELAEGIFEQCKQNRLVSAITLQRTFMETEALFGLFIDKLLKSINTKNFNDFKDLLEINLLGARSDIATKKFNRPNSINVLTYIDQMNKKIPNYRNYYDFLSEFAHPNSAGLCKIYSKIDWNNKTISFGNNRERIDINIIPKQLNISLDWFINEYSESADLLDQLLKLEKTI